MKKLIWLFFIPLISLLALEEEELVWDSIPSFSVQEQTHILKEAIAEERWWDVIDLADTIAYNFPTSPFSEDLSFVMGEAYFKLGQLELANDYFTGYLYHTLSPKHFEEALRYKFTIAEAFKNGAKKPLFSSHKMPKIVPAKEDAIQIYDEIITTLPQSDIALQSLLSKALIQVELEDYTPAHETLDLLIRKAPKHELAAEAYLKKMDAFLLAAKAPSPDPNILDLADVCLRKFRLGFPREPKIAAAEKKMKEVQSCFSENLFTVGKFFEKTKKYEASAIYYRKVIARFPLTDAAGEAKERLEKLEQSGKIDSNA